MNRDAPDGINHALKAIKINHQIVIDINAKIATNGLHRQGGPPPWIVSEITVIKGGVNTVVKFAWTIVWDRDIQIARNRKHGD